MAEREPGEEAGQTVGLLCGGGELPWRAADALHRRGCRVVAVGIKGEADPAIEGHADEVHWTSIAKLGGWIRVFRAAHVDALLMVGSIRKRRMFDSKLAMLPDWRTVKFYYGQLVTRQDHTILGAMADEFEKEGIPVRSIVDYCPDMLVQPGCLTRAEPDKRQWADIRFGWPLAKQVAALQIGQTIVVKHLAVVAVEAMEGTDKALQRGGELAKGGAVAVKVAKQGHDVRFDIPCIGPQTVATLAAAGISVLAIEAGCTILLDPAQVRAAADKAGVCIVAVTDQDVAGARQ
jgi:hypothetical protein